MSIYPPTEYSRLTVAAALLLGRPRPGPRRRRRLRVPVPAPVLDTLGYALAVAAGALAHHLGTLLGHLG